MTREEIKRLAREAGFSVTWPETVVNFERFAALVAAAEREACADVCDRVANLWPRSSLKEGWRKGYVDGGSACRNLIRERGQE